MYIYICLYIYNISMYVCLFLEPTIYFHINAMRNAFRGEVNP